MNQQLIGKLMVDVNCHARAWLYTAICLSAATGVVLLALVPYIVTYCRDKLKLKWNRITNGGNTTTTTPHTAIEAGNYAYNTEPSAPLTENSPLIRSTTVEGRPPPYSYDYEAPPPYQP